MSEDVFRWVIAAGVLLACLASVWQALMLAAIFRTGKEAQKAGKEAQIKLAPLVDHFEDLLAAFNKFLATSNRTLEENRPRIADITAETLVMAKSVRQHAERIGELIDDTSGRARERIEQIDRTLEQTVEQVEHAGEAVKSAVLKPVKEVNGIVAGVKAALNTYAQGGNRNSPEHATQDEEMFI
jgi:methyl-accepting chemotaxis protein